jgi:RNase P/RNase MRP subunit POP5
MVIFDNKMPEKRIMPSLRERKRYLLLEKVKKEDVEKAIIEYIGSLGYGKSGLIFVKNNIIAINREMINKIRAAFAVYSKSIKVLGVSGTLKGLSKNFKN